MNQENSQFDYRIYTDGGCLVNPDGPGGIGVVVMNLKTGERKEFLEAYEKTTNNRMEIRAAVKGLENVPEGTVVELFSDSQYLVKTALGMFRESKNVDLWKLLHQAEKGKKIVYQWVRGHNGDRWNERCDELATQAMHTMDRKTDEGYDAARAAAQKEKKAASAPKAYTGGSRADIQIPEKFCHDPEQMAPAAYASKYQVNLSCAAAIQNFILKKEKSFRAYAALKTGGMDTWSRMSRDSILEKTSQEEWDIVSGVFPDEKQAMSCMKWRCRGLGLQDAVRKVQVDQEVAKSAMHG